MGNSEIAQWILSMPACAEVNAAVQELAETHFITSDQKKRLTRDEEDKLTLFRIIHDRTPVVQDSSL